MDDGTTIICLQFWFENHWNLCHWIWVTCHTHDLEQIRRHVAWLSCLLVHWHIKRACVFQVFGSSKSKKFFNIIFFDISPWISHKQFTLVSFLFFGGFLFVFCFFFFFFFSFLLYFECLSKMIISAQTQFDIELRITVGDSNKDLITSFLANSSLGRNPKFYFLFW